MASRGAELCLADIRQEPLDAITKDLRDKYDTVKVFSKAVNVTVVDEVASWLDEGIRLFGKLDGAANMAGISGVSGIKPITEVTDEEWDSIMDINVKGTFNCLKAELQRMSNHGSIVNMSSIAGLRSTIGWAPYSTSKVGRSKLLGTYKC